MYFRPDGKSISESESVCGVSNSIVCEGGLERPYTQQEILKDYRNYKKSP